MTEGSQFNRRKFLQASVGGVSVPFVSYGALAETTRLPIVIRKRGSWTNPLDVEQMMDLKRRAVDHHVSAGGTPPTYLVDAVPGFPDHAKLVDYIVGVKPNGVPTQHVEVVGDPGSVANAHRRADKMVNEVRKKARGEK